MSQYLDMPAYDYASIPIGYYDTIHQRGRGIQSKWHHLKFARVRAELPPGARLLDVACGPGTFLGTLPETMTSVGLDIASAQIDYACARYATANRRFALMTPGVIPLASDSFDCVTLIELIEHIPADEAAQLLAECRRVLRPGGKLVVTTPNYAGFWPVLEQVTNRLGQVSYADQHITRYRAPRLSELLSTAGFATPHINTCLFAAPFFAALNWSLADTIARFEPAFLTEQVGHLLIGRAIKP